MVELVDTRDLKSLDRNIVPVQVRPRVPTKLIMNELFLIYKITLDNFKFLLLALFFGVIFGLIIFFSVTPTYKSDATLRIQDKVDINNVGSKGGLSSLSSIGGLADIGNLTGDSRTSRYKNQLLSRQFIIGFINKNQLKPYLHAIDSYDKEKDELIFDHRVYDVSSKTWKKKFNKNAVAPPDMLSYEIFTNHYYQVTETKDKFIKITIFHSSPTIAKEMLENLITDFNLFIKNDEIKKANEIIKYLNEATESSMSNEATIAINYLLTAQYRTLALAMATEDVALVMIDPPFQEIKKVKPSGTIILLLSVAFAVIFSYSFLLLRYKFSENKEF